MDLEQIKKIDSSDMYSVLKAFPEQVKSAVNIADSFTFNNFDTKGVSNIILTGLGGSAIGGDYARSYLTYELKIPMVINRNYLLPEFASENTLVIISSYSGNTEETISAFKDALKRKCRIICISTGGEVGKMAESNNLNWIKVPPGLQPRCALGYSFFIVLKTLIKLGFVEDKTDEINSCVNVLLAFSNVYSDPANHANKAIEIAKSLKDTLPVIYSSNDILDSVNLRWRGQISENAQMLAYGNLFPEMNHNELVGWHQNEGVLSKIAVIMMKDKEDYERTKLRMDIVEGIIKKYAASVTFLEDTGNTKLERIFALTYLGDWMSFYLAVMNGLDPTPVKAIDFLKNELSKQ